MNGIVRKAAAVLLSAAMLLSLSSCSEEKTVGNLEEVELQPGDIYAVISIMDYGDITAKLFPDVAPESVKRFTELAERGYYEMKTIHRVIDNYAIQGGSLNGDGTDGVIPDAQYVPIETSASAYNFYGALCFAANSKGSYAQFYIVDNNKPQKIDNVIDKLTEQLADEELSARLLEEDRKYYQDYLDKLKAIPEAVKEKYADVGGLYQLDGTTTVFGQMIDGFDVLDAITSCEVVSGNAIDDKQGTFSKPINSIVIEKVTIINIAAEEPEETTTTAKKPSKTTTTTTTDEVVAAVPVLTQSEQKESSEADYSEDDDSTLAPAETDADGVPVYRDEEEVVVNISDD